MLRDVAWSLGLEGTSEEDAEREVFLLLFLFFDLRNRELISCSLLSSSFSFKEFRIATLRLPPYCWCWGGEKEGAETGVTEEGWDEEW